MTPPVRNPFLYSAVPVLLIIFLYAFRGALIAPLVKKVIITEAKESFGVHLAIGAIKGSYFSNFIFQDMELSFSGGPTPEHNTLSIKEGSIHFRLPDLFVSASSFLQNCRIDINGLNGELGLRHLLLLQKQPHQKAEDFKKPGLFFVPHLKIHNSAITLIVEQRHLSLSGILFNFAPRNSSGMFKGGEGNIVLEKAVIKDRGNVLVESSFSAKFELSENRLAIKNVYIDNGSLISQAVFSYEINDGVFSLDGSMDVLSGQLQTAASFDKGNVKARLQLEGLNLMNLRKFSFAGNTPVNGHVSAAATVSLNTEDLENIDAALSLEVHDFAGNKVRFDDLVLQAKSRSGKISVEHLESILGRNRLSLQDVVIPTRYVFAADIHSILRKSSGNINIKLEDIPKLYRALGAGLSADMERKAGNHSMDVAAHMKNGLLTISKGKLKTRTGTIDFQYGELQIPEVGSPLLSTEVKGAFHVDVPELHELLGLFEIPEAHGRVDGVFILNGSLTSLKGKLTSHGKDISIKGIPFGDIHLEATINDNKIIMQNIVAARNRDRITLSGIYDLKNRLFENAVLEANLADTAAYTIHLPQQLQSLGAVSGRFHVNGPLHAPDISAHVKGAGMVAGNLQISEMNLVLHNKGKVLHVETFSLSTQDAHVLLSGKATHDIAKREIDFSLKTMAVFRNKKKWELLRPAHFGYLPEKGLEIKDFIFGSRHDSFTLRGSISSQNNINIISSISSHNGEGWIDLLSEQLSFQDAGLEVVIEGNISQPTISAKGRASRVGSRNLPNSFTGGLEFTCSPAGIDIRHFNWKAANGSLIDIRGYLPVSLGRKLILIPGDLDLALSINMPDLKMLGPFLPAEYSSQGTVQAEGKLAGSWNNPSARLKIDMAGIDAPILDKYLIPGPFIANLSCRLEDDQIILDNFSAFSPDVEIHSKGRLTDIPSFQYLFQHGERASKIRIAGKIDLRADDIGWIAGRIKKLKKMSGGVKASLTLTGKLAAPEITGSFVLENGELRPDVAMPSLRKIFLKASLNSNQFTLEKLHGEIGGSPFRASGSVNMRADIPMADIHIIGENLLFYREEGIKVRADADLLFAGPVNKLNITGTLSLTDGSFTKNFDFLSPLQGAFRPGNLNKLILPSFHEEPLKNATLDIGIAAKNPFRLKNNIARGRIVPELKIQGTGEAPYLNGKLYIEEGRLELPAGRLYLDNGLIHFPENDPENSRLDIQGSSRMAGYDIALNIQGKLDEPVVTLSSSPPLSEEDLLYLVLMGKLPATAHGSLTARQGKNMKIALYLAQGILARFLAQESKLSDTDLLERFEIDVGRDITRKGDETINVQFRLFDEIITDGGKLYITSEKDVFDAFNIGLKILIRFQ